MSQTRSRRKFLAESSALGFGYFALSGVTAADSKSPNERLRIACVGVGGKGSSDTDQAGSVGDVVALCDVDEDYLNNKGKNFPKAKKYFDFRKMLEEVGKDIDAVTVSTPDHTHAPASIMAMKMGKHVYCQKPLTHSVYEARQMLLVSKEKKVCTQMGNQGSAADGLRRAAELVQGGLIGKVTEAHVWTNRPVWPQAPGITARPPGEQPVPKYLHWDEWLGPAPARPFYHGTDASKKRGTYHDFNWRGWWDFGTGALGDMACHTANLAFRALKLGYPISIVAENAPLNPETYPAWAKVVYQFAARGEMPAVKFTWYEGKRDGITVVPSSDLVKHQREAETGASIFFKNNVWNFRLNNDKPKVVSSGSFLVGDKAILFSPDDYGADAYVISSNGIERVTGKPEKLPINGGGDGGMKREWADAIKQNKPEIAQSNFDYASVLTEAILLGNVAIKSGKMLEYNGEKMEITNNKEANQHLRREYRKGWTL